MDRQSSLRAGSRSSSPAGAVARGVDHGLALRRNLLSLLHLLEFLRFITALLLDRLSVMSHQDDQPAWSALVDTAATDRLLEEAIWAPSSPPMVQRWFTAPRAMRRRAEPAQDGDSTAICTICLAGLEEVAGGYQVTELSNCSHAFHAACIDAWIASGEAETCPLCRTPMLPTTWNGLLETLPGAS